MTNLVLASSGIGEELAKVLPVLIFGILAAGVQWLKNRSGKPSIEEPTIDEVSDADELSTQRPVVQAPREDVFQTRRETPAAPATIAAGRVPLEMLRRESAEQDRRHRKQQEKAERRSRAEQAQRLASAIKQNAVLTARQTEVVAARPVVRAPRDAHSVIGAVDAAALRRAIVLNEVLGPPVALREMPGLP